MQSERASLFATDPPHLVGYDDDKGATSTDAYDRKRDDPAQGEELYDGFISAAIAEAITEDAARYCWHASRNQAIVERVWDRHGAFVRQQIIWVKDRAIFGRSWYQWQHEPCLFGWIRGNRPREAPSDKQRTVWQFTSSRTETSEDHPTAKPVELFEIPMLEHTSRGDWVYEPFTGSGTQHVAAERLGRICYGIEIPPAFVALTLQRLTDMGLEPRLAGVGARSV